MFKQLSFLLFILLCLAFGFSSCKNNGSTQQATTDNISTSGSQNVDSIRRDFVDSYLDTLWVDSSSFKSLPKSDIAFRFLIDKDEKLLMNGWSVKSTGGYQSNPDLNLSNGRSSKLQYKAGNYLGNLLLSKKNITDIQSLITSTKSRYVLFEPIDPSIATFRGQVTYNILLTNDDPHPLVKIISPAFVHTGIITNPSPPGTAN